MKYTNEIQQIIIMILLLLFINAYKNVKQENLKLKQQNINQQKLIQSEYKNIEILRRMKNVKFQ